MKIQLKEKYGVLVKFVDKDYSLTKKLVDWDKRGVVGSFNAGPPPTMFLLSNNASELTIFHEKVHMEIWYNKLNKMHIIDEEKLVFDAIYRNKSRWTNAELLDSYNYVNKLIYETNQKGKNFPYLFIPEIEGLKFIVNL
ncbi:MAG: zincin-like metallopeptidase toxin domain-containing protein [Bacteroidota bacterium]